MNAIGVVVQNSMVSKISHDGSSGMNEKLIEKLKADLDQTNEQIMFIEMNTPQEEWEYSHPLRYLNGRKDYISHLLQFIGAVG